MKLGGLKRFNVGVLEKMELGGLKKFNVGDLEKLKLCGNSFQRKLARQKR